MWPQSIAKYGMISVPNVFLLHYRDLKITHAEAMLILHIMRSTKSPSIATLAREMGVKTGQIRSHLRVLERKNILMRELQSGGITRYRLEPLFSRLERYLELTVRKD